MKDLIRLTCFDVMQVCPVQMRASKENSYVYPYNSRLPEMLRLCRFLDSISNFRSESVPGPAFKLQSKLNPLDVCPCLNLTLRKRSEPGPSVSAQSISTMKASSWAGGMTRADFSPIGVPALVFKDPGKK
ncbi:hypothetical protein GUITHDRAFT_99623 [Guillardia theta CCMP2712]|uniref:Uncharacterized protein n=1 Tax=Guillardia theta (strain CCMP2712) TaxID=905079 RepID=L1K314_GUITC|nr:hypothetical protein GUITHDRAFT_99623 [Guillardia theta CCMP2712]EKX54977.1 hypothetical protein GUITHDRAFT_99623 [Guillardia theta CCMP2712]|eukprot:XP_005841957.1 hypothetical protein GUITHDRAFT_99623 [Guillardia theta CCMP2712]